MGRRKKEPLAPDAQQTPFWSDDITKPFARTLPLPIPIDTVHPESTCRVLNKAWFTTVSSQLAPFPPSSEIHDLVVASVSKPEEQQHKSKRARLEVDVTSARARQSKEQPHAVRNRRLRVYPTSSQHTTLRSWQAVYRWTYNRCVEHDRRRFTHDQPWSDISDFRKLFENNDAIVEMVRDDKLSSEFALRIIAVGAEVRDAAIDDYVISRKIELEKNKVDPSHIFRFTFISCRDNCSLTFPSHYWTREPNSIYGANQLDKDLVAVSAAVAASDAEDIDTIWPSNRARANAERLAAIADAQADARAAEELAIADGKKAVNKSRRDLIYHAKRNGLPIPPQLKFTANPDGLLISYLRRSDVLRMRPRNRTPEEWDAIVPAEMPMAYLLTRTRRGRYYLQVPKYVPAAAEPCAPPHSVCSIDPGVRTPFTVYGAEGVATEIGCSEDNERLLQALKRADRIQRKLHKTRNKLKPHTEPGWQEHNAEERKQKKGARRDLRRAYLATLERVRERVRDMHNRTATWLCQTYRVILIPVFETQRLVASRCLSKQTKRLLLRMAHFEFRQTLIAKAALYPDCKVIVVDEQYTSQTCGVCGHLHKTSDKVYKCTRSGCGFVADRDINGARNILLRYLSLHCV